MKKSYLLMALLSLLISCSDSMPVKYKLEVELFIEGLKGDSNRWYHDKEYARPYSFEIAKKIKSMGYELDSTMNSWMDFVEEENEDEVIRLQQESTRKLLTFFSGVISQHWKDSTKLSPETYQRLKAYRRELNAEELAVIQRQKEEAARTEMGKIFDKLHKIRDGVAFFDFWCQEGVKKAHFLDYLADYEKVTEDLKNPESLAYEKFIEGRLFSHDRFYVPAEPQELFAKNKFLQQAYIDEEVLFALAKHRCQQVLWHESCSERVLLVLAKQGVSSVLKHEICNKNVELAYLQSKRPDSLLLAKMTKHPEVMFALIRHNAFKLAEYSHVLAKNSNATERVLKLLAKQSCSSVLLNENSTESVAIELAKVGNTSALKSKFNSAKVELVYLASLARTKRFYKSVKVENAYFRTAENAVAFLLKNSKYPEVMLEIVKFYNETSGKVYFSDSRLLLADNPHATDEVLEAYIKSKGDAYIHDKVFAHKNYGRKAGLALMAKGKLSFKELKGIVQNRQLTDDDLAAFISKALAKSYHVLHDNLKSLMTNKAFAKKSLLACLEHKAMKQDVFVELMKSLAFTDQDLVKLIKRRKNYSNISDFYFYDALVSNPNVGKESCEALFRSPIDNSATKKLIANPNCSMKILQSYVRDSRLKLIVFSNSAYPVEEVLKAIASEKRIEKKKAYYTAYLKRKDVSAELINSEFLKELATKAEDDYKIYGLLKSGKVSDENLLKAKAYHKTILRLESTSISAIEKIIVDMKKVTQSEATEILSRKDCTLAILERFKVHENNYVRRAVALHKNCPAKTLEDLLYDKDPLVQQAVRLSMSQRGL